MCDSYLEYKACTTKFVQWVLTAATKIQKASKNLPNTLSALQERTGIITEFPSNRVSLGEDLCGSFEEAMKAGYRSIQLRKYVHSIMKESDDTTNENRDDCHLHCIIVLKKCYSMLHHWMKSQTPDEFSSTTVPTSYKSDVFDMHLVLLEELEDDSEEEEEAVLQSLSYNSIDFKTFEDIDDGIFDSAIATLLFLHDMLSATELLQQLWEDVKEQKKSILTAIAATMVAYRQVCQSNAVLQLQHPSISSMKELLCCCGSKENRDERFRRIYRSLREETAFEMKVITRLGEVEDALVCMTEMFGGDLENEERKVMLGRDETPSGPPFIEQCNLVGSEFEEYIRFLFTEYPRLYNAYYHALPRQCKKEKINEVFSQQPLAKDFFDAFIPHFQTGKVSIPQVFLTHCWLLSVQVLQDKEHRYLGRNLYWLRKLGRDIDQTVKEYASDTVLPELFDQHLNKIGECFYLKDLKCDISYQPFGVAQAYWPLHNNPILQGCVVLDKLLNYQKYSCKLMERLSSLQCAIVHMYNGLKQEHVLKEEIPVLEEMMQFYQPHIFMNGTLPNTVGTYDVQFSLARDQTIAAVALSKSIDDAESTVTQQAALSALRNLSKADAVKIRSRLDASVLSTMYQVLKDKDLSELLKKHAKRNTMLSNKQLLQATVDQMETELFTTRNFTWKTTFVQLEVYKFFKHLCFKDSLFHSAYQSARENALIETKGTTDYHSMGLEIAVMGYVLKSLDDDAKWGTKHKRSQILSFVAKEMVDWFVNRYQGNAVDSMFHFLPQSSTNWLREEFGAMPYSTVCEMMQQDKENTNKQFVNIMNQFNRMEKLLGTTSKERKKELLHSFKNWITRLKEQIKQCPAVCLCYNSTEYQSPTILDYSLVITEHLNKAIGLELAQWLIQMWGYHYDGLSYPVVRTHLHVAFAKKSYFGAFPYFICENGCQDINAQCSLDGNTPYHYAIEMEDKSIAKWFSTYFNVNPEIPNHKGLTVVDIWNNHKAQGTVDEQIKKINEAEQQLLILIEKEEKDDDDNNSTSQTKKKQSKKNNKKK